ncbi:MAG: 5-formyltetrahydrofolate cyclo-ligase [Lysobacterales bacterium]|jgi:5-formyltetrahydrofolate cyclo-ligase
MKRVPDKHNQKSDLRKELRSRRAALAPGRRAELNAAINRHLIEYTQTARISDLAAFHAFDGEPDLSAALQHLAENGVTLALPVVREVPGRSYIAFHEWAPGCDMAPNRFGIMEPTGTDEIPLVRFDLVLLPLVSWDRRGGRLGMGESYYDRAFQPFAQSPRPVRMGVAFEHQRAEHIPLDPWDIRLHAMVTEKGWFTCPR